MLPTLFRRAISDLGEQYWGRPVNVVTTMGRVAQRAESIRSRPSGLPCDTSDVAVALAQAAVQISETKTADAIIAITEAGNTANAVASFRPQVPVLALSPAATVVRQMSLLSGIQPSLMPEFSSTDEMITAALSTATALDVVEPGQTVVLVSGAGDIIRYLQV